MIKYPQNWQSMGNKILVNDVAQSIEESVALMGIRNLSLSGGIDSTLLLYFMKKVNDSPIHCYTISIDKNHQDYIHAKLATKFFDVEFHPYFTAESKDADDVVRIFYNRLRADGITDIITGDGIDEFSCGYYAHQKDPSEKNYISWIRRLTQDHLIPLNKNSGGISVYLPYLAPDVISMFSLIPIFDKVDSGHRKKVMVSIADGKLPKEIINRNKFGFCDAATLKGRK